ncbi:CoB--CoM heterodisulfide reductase subunit C [Methanoculleus sp. 7T]|jgi:heterodisulfide reductase subunit C|uniref:CoB--CoM heterodisulfide reductase subunit C n=1 Tax=Methanoculleus sp. 7T TaxID=2937282 RepID=UPI0020C028BE|nr:CoB--CoM heterodisulfide reductase subunit C [Methanoculleus sp. 7T]MCK8517963.1 CoB--CoM heterodisulfide reductase subunit C [Methanoculleus sp. 7T]
MAVKKDYKDQKLAEKLRDRKYYIPDSNPEFIKDVEKLGQTAAHMCYQCGTCTGSCPSAPRSSYRIRLFMRKAVLGLEEEVLTDPDLWLCTTCYSCTDRCPRDLAPTDVIMAMRNLAFKRDIVPRNFLQTVQLIYKTGHGVPNNDVNRAARQRLGLEAEPETTHKYPEYLPGIRKILDHYRLKEDADRILSEGE